VESERRLGGGRYVEVGVLGEGAQGVTFAARDAESGRAVAIKRFDVRGARSWKDVELAERETRVLASLDHPLVPRYIEHFEEDGALYLVMEKVEGESLDTIVRREGRLPEAEVRRFLASADRALSYLHGRGSPVVHRDVKPRNVIRRPDGSYVLVDFGAVSELLVRRGSSTVVGTLGYMAPEQLQGRAEPATDVYAVGATALAALTGKEPETLPHKGLKIDVRAALGTTVSADLLASLDRMVEPDPDLRPRTLAAALDQVRASSLPPAPAAPKEERGARKKKRREPVDPSSEDEIVKSVRRLLWLLWGLSWVIVPLLLRPFHAQQLIPLVMFGSLAALFVVTWHKGAMIRHLVRRFRGEEAEPARLRVEDEAPLPERERGPRVETAGPSQQVRVHTTDLSEEETYGDTDIGTRGDEGRRRRR